MTLSCPHSGAWEQESVAKKYRNKIVNIIFAGTPEFAAVSLEKLIASPHKILAVFTQADKPAGRGRKVQYSAVKKIALAHALPLYQPVQLKEDSILQTIKNYHCDAMVVAAYGIILPETLLSLPKYGCINIHASLLPRWRGAAPIQRAILAGDKMTGISIMQMDKGLDTGDILYQKSCLIDNSETGSSLHDKLAQIGADAVLHSLNALQEGNLTAQKQDDNLATYAQKLSKTEALINWQDDALIIERKIRAFTAWPVAYTVFEKKNIRIWSAQAYDVLTDENYAPGYIFRHDKTGLWVQCGTGILKISQLQFPGKKVINACDLLNARSLEHYQL